jgi:Rrf2 family protein
VSRKTEYGLRAMVALAQMAGVERPVPLREVSENEAIPEQFLDQIMVKLRRAGLVTSVRGAGGGYRLSRRAEEISIGSIVRVLEGSLSPINCITEVKGILRKTSAICIRGVIRAVFGCV